MRKTALLTSLVLLSVVAYAQERIALVVGNAAYEHTSQLSNPVNDASDIAATLENLGFSVSRLYDASRGDIQKAVDEFANRAKKTGTQVALFYYSGHGVEYEGVNYVIPVNARIEDEYQLLDQGVSMDRVTRALDRGRAEFNMVVLDACRDNPFFKTKSGGGRGLAVMSGSGKGSVIAFATSPGEVAQDGSGRNSPFTKAFVKNAAVPGLEVSTLMRQVVGEVEKSTKGRQKPWFNVSYTGNVYLSAAEDLTGATARAAAINREVAVLEAEIAKRQQAINAARNQEEKIRLEAEQRRARAEESAKRLAATQLASIEEQARRVLEQRKSEEALRNQMEKQLETERVNLSQKAQERRAQLAALKQQDKGKTGAWQQLATIATINQAIADLNTRFDGLVSQMEKEVKTLYDGQVEALKASNPKAPFETQAEYEALIDGMAKELRAKQRTETNKRRNELNQARRIELADLQKQVAQKKTALNNARFTLNASATRVEVDNFDTQEKHFPMELQSTDENIRLTMPAFYALKAKDRQAMMDEYYGVYSAAQSDGLGGEITYKALEVFPDLWLLKPGTGRVLNLLEDDAVLARATEGRDMLVSTAGKLEVLGAAIRLESGTGGQAELTVNGRDVGKTPYVYTSPAGKTGTIRAEYRWPGGKKRVVSVALEGGLNNTVRAFPERIERLAMLWKADIRNMKPSNNAKITDTLKPRFTWYSVSGAARYELQMAETRNAVANAEHQTVKRPAYTPSGELVNLTKHYWRVRAVDSDGAVGPWSSILSVSIRFPIGDTGPAGGIVFYDKGYYSDGWRYLEATPRDQGEYNWKKAKEICADLVLGGYDDWFLPSKDQLNELYKQKEAVGGFSSDYYWSSSETNFPLAWGQNFGSGSQYDIHSFHGNRVRAVRAF